MLVSVSDLAWENLKEFPQHKYRKPEIHFNGHAFVRVEHGTSAKGLSAYLQQFLTNPTPHIPSHHYNSQRPFNILPESFVDARDEQQKVEDYEWVGLPGDEPNYISIMPTSYDPISRTQEWSYTHWNGGGDVCRHSLLEFPALLRVAPQITDYWHLSLSKPPKSKTEKISAFLNALGLGYLQHPLLKKPNKPGPMISEEFK